MTLIVAPNKRRSTNPAQMDISGSISNGANWVETITIVDQDGAQVTGVGSDTWELQLREDDDDTAADLTLTSIASQLTCTVGGSSTTLAISATSDDVAGLDPQDYIIDIASKTAGGVITHRGHGRISVFGSPISF